MNQSAKQNDHLGLQNDKEARKILRDETLIFSDKIIKVNKRGANQERLIMISNKAIYNLKHSSGGIFGMFSSSKKLEEKRRIDYKSVRGLTVSKTSEDFVLHGLDDDYDYHYKSGRKMDICEVIAQQYLNDTKKDLTFAENEQKDLSSFVTSKSDKKANPNFSKMPTTGLFSLTNKELYKSLNANATVSSSGGTIVSSIIGDATLDDFTMLKVIGRGTFAKVFLVQHNKSKKMYAMKSINKDILIEEDQIENCFVEKRILESIKHPFLVDLQFCFQTPETIFYVMPFVRGGEIFQQLKREKVFDEQKVKFYAAQLALALQHLHNQNYIYRDMKPENVLIDENGYIKLTDFGLAKKLVGNEKALSFCGTPEYIAPEVLSGDGHNRMADWWSYGILVFELLCGLPPFYSDNLERMYELIKLAELKFPKKVKLSQEAQDFIRKLLDRNPTTRLGHKAGLNDIKSHPFFNGLDFDKIYRMEIQPPFKPDLRGDDLVSNFDEEFTGEDKISLDPVDEAAKQIIKESEALFQAFSK